MKPVSGSGVNVPSSMPRAKGPAAGQPPPQPDPRPGELTAPVMDAKHVEPAAARPGLGIGGVDLRSIRAGVKLTAHLSECLVRISAAVHAASRLAHEQQQAAGGLPVAAISSIAAKLISLEADLSAAIGDSSSQRLGLQMSRAEQHPLLQPLWDRACDLDRGLHAYLKALPDSGALSRGALGGPVDAAALKRRLARLLTAVAELHRLAGLCQAEWRALKPADRSLQTILEVDEPPDEPSMPASS